MAAMTTQATMAIATLTSILSMVDSWIAFAQVSPASEKSYRKGIRRLAEYCRANSISAPSRADMLAYRAYLQEKYSPATVNLYLTAAKLFFSWLNVEGEIIFNPTVRIKGVKIRAGHRKDALSTEQVKKIFSNFDVSTLKGKRDKAMFALMVTAGLRTIEISRANVGDIIEREGKYFLLVQGKGHSEKDAEVRIADGVFVLIKSYLESRADISADSPLFASCSNRNFGGRMITNSISCIVKDAMRRAGFDSKRLTAHSLRHTAATTALKAGATLREVQQVLRHTNISITQIYLHDMDRLNNNAECLAAAAFGF